MKINFSNPVLKKLDKKILFQTVNQGWISSQGELVKKFEKNFAKWQGAKYAVSTSNCTTSLLWSANDFTTLGLIPKLSSPIRDSPDIFKRIFFQLKLFKIIPKIQ